MYRPRDYHINLSQGKISHAITYMRNFKNNINELIYKTEIDSQT